VRPLDNSIPVPFWKYDGARRSAACPDGWKFIPASTGVGGADEPMGSCARDSNIGTELRGSVMALAESRTGRAV
jgi:hypothetical protein